jgi:AraC family transcriptional regulator
MQTAATSLPFGMYLGVNQIRRELPGFSVSLLSPAFRAEDVPLHEHDHASFVCVLSGAYLSSADAAGPVIRKPTLIFNPAGTTHRDSFAVAEGRFLAVSISSETLRIASDGAALPCAAIAFDALHRVDTALRLAGQCTAHGHADNPTMEAMCWELLSTVSGVSLWPDGLGTAQPSWIPKARELLHDRGSDSLAITEMAQQMGVHPVYFARAFRQVFHCTPGEYRMRCRLRDALARMRNSKLPLSEIALSAGFFDQSHFTTAFRKHFGMSPQAYRRRLHGPRAGAEVQFMQEEM